MIFSPKKLLALCACLAAITGWTSFATTRAEEAKSAPASPNQMIAKIEINRPSNSRRYRSPYVAVWLEDKDQYPVRTLALWLMKDRPGPRWHARLRQWYKGDQMRKLAEDQDLIDGMSGATRSPGKYKLGWDGKDNDGKLLPAGTYTLFVEAVREHGTYQLIKQEIKIGDEPFKKSLKGNEEIKAVELEYTPDGAAN